MSGVRDELVERIRREGPIPFDAFVEAATPVGASDEDFDRVALGAQSRDRIVLVVCE